jgi:N-acetylglucosaminyl-diphospho-decaprenol L-rhamnosyltransferase
MRPTAYIPNFNGVELLAQLLASLERQTVDLDVVVVDNGSTDDSVAMARSRFPWVNLIPLSRNYGFGGALNLAIAEFPGDPIILLNNDVQCEPDFVAEMLRAAQSGAEMVSGLLTMHGSPGVIDSAGIVADRRTLMAFDYLHGEPLGSAPGMPPPLAPTGGAALYTRSAFEGVGGFDEKIHAYYEDLDLGLRLRASGMDCALAAGATGSHRYSATLGARNGQKYALTGWSRAYLLRRYGVMRSPAAATRTVLGETAICAGQIVLDGTARGALGRLRGWRSATGLDRRPLPDEGLTELPLLSALARRLRRRDSVALPPSTPIVRQAAGDLAMQPAMQASAQERPLDS